MIMPQLEHICNLLYPRQTADLSVCLPSLKNETIIVVRNQFDLTTLCSRLEMINGPYGPTILTSKAGSDYDLIAGLLIEWLQHIRKGSLINTTVDHQQSTKPLRVLLNRHSNWLNPNNNTAQSICAPSRSGHRIALELAFRRWCRCRHDNKAGLCEVPPYVIERPLCHPRHR